MSDTCNPTFTNHHLELFQTCFSDWGTYIAILLTAIVIPGLQTLCYNFKLQYSREALELDINKRGSIMWIDVGFYAGFCFVHIISLCL